MLCVSTFWWTITCLPLASSNRIALGIRLATWAVKGSLRTAES